MRSSHRLLILALLLAPLLFGTVETWSIGIMEISILLTFFLWLREGSGNSGYSNFIKVIDVPLLRPLIFILFLGMIHLLPLPLPIIKIISPSVYEVYNSKILGGISLYTLSLYPHGTLLEVIRFLTSVLAFFLTFQLFSKEKELLGLIKAMMVIGVLIALIGLFQMIFYNGKLLWFRELRQGGTPFGPYVNRNHFAGLMEMLIPLSIGMLLRFSPPLSFKKGLRYGLSEFMRHERANISILSITSVVIMITALFVSLSRGGIIGLSLSMLLFGIMLLMRNSTKKKGLLIVLISSITILTVGWFGWEKIIERFESLKKPDPSAETRFHNWQDSLGIILDFPLLGTGLGTYEQVYPRYKTIPSQEIWEHAHNDIIEGAVEMGVIGMVIAFYIIFRFYRLMFSALRKRRFLEARLLGIGAMTGVTGILIHSITDFNLHIGANALYFAVLSAVAIISINIKPSEERRTLLLQRDVPVYSRFFSYGFVFALTILVSSIIIAEIYYASIDGPLKDDRENLLKKKDMLSMAMILNPLNPDFPFARGNISSVLGMDDDALRDYKRAVRLNPLEGEYLQMLALSFDRKGQKDMAQGCFAMSIKNDPTSSWLRKNYALWLLSKGKKGEAIIEMKNAMNLDPSKTRLYLTGLILSGLSPDEIRDVIPDNSLSQLLYGRFREERGELDSALSAYMNALSIMKREGNNMTEVYLRIGGIYEKKGMLNEALFIYKDGVTQRPDDYSLRLNLAKVYEKLGITQRAIEEYQRTLVLNPLSQYAQQRLRRLRNDKR